MASSRSDLALTWVGGDGSEWLIHGRLHGGRRRGDQGAILRTTGGLLDPPASRRRTAAARQDGSTPGTWKIDERTVTLDVVIVAREGRTLAETVEAWRRSWQKPGRLVAHSRRGVRWLNLQLSGDPDVDLDRDPHRIGAHFEKVLAFGGDPFAHSEPWAREYTIPGSGTLDIEWENPCSQYTYPRFTCTPGEWELPDGNAGTVPLADSDGKTFRVDTDPMMETVSFEDSPDGWKLLLGRGFQNRLDAYTPPATVTITGPPGGQVRVTIDRRWMTLW